MICIKLLLFLSLSVCLLFLFLYLIHPPSLSLSPCLNIDHRHHSSPTLATICLCGEDVWASVTVGHTATVAPPSL